MTFNSYELARPFLHALDPERAHRLSVAALRLGLGGSVGAAADPSLASKPWGIPFANPLGLAAGFDKNATVFDAVLGLGFGFAEIGTVTLRPQQGNPRPRLFRLAADGAVINRMGFNNDGLVAVRRRLERRRGLGGRLGPVGANVGPNRDASDPVADCAACVEALASLVDYLVVNVSSPNTPGLRGLQAQDVLRPLLSACLDARGRRPGAPPLLVKVAPDLSVEERRAIAGVILEVGIDGLIATNTTIARPPGLRDPRRAEAGGLSGRPLFALSTEVLADLYRLTEGRVPMIAAGGIASGADAYAKIRAGASLVQLYTALVYRGPRLVGQILAELARRIRADGFDRIEQAIGSGNSGGALATNTTAHRG
ncbi:MAG: quinone-dependent dihydroorotate dehydrogenase [Rhodospirillales bacterium]|nr:quinone-dependent dihydroorotate dehydrogenase [Rhodospirillales bacterium]